MLHITNYGKRFLKVGEFEDICPDNTVKIEDGGLIDPYRDFLEGRVSSIERSRCQGTVTDLEDNGATFTTWRNENLFEWLEQLVSLLEEEQRRDDNKIYVCQIPQSWYAIQSLLRSISNEVQRRYTNSR